MVEDGRNVCVNVGVMDGVKMVGTAVFVGDAASITVGVAVFVRTTGSGVIFFTVVAGIVAE